MTVPLPEKGDGSRRQRRELRRQRGRRSALRLMAVVLGLVVAAGLAWLAVTLLADDETDAPDRPDAVSTTVVDSPGPALVALADDTGRLYGLTLFVPATSTIVHVPPGTLVEVPSLGLAPLQEAAAEGGDELLRDSLENLLGARIDEVVRLGPAELEAMVLESGPLGVGVAEPVEQREASGRVTVVIPSGSFTILPENVVRLLSTLGDGTGLELLVRHQLFWTAYLASVADARIDAIESMAGADVRHRVLPVEAVAGLEGEELYRVNTELLDALVRRVLPDAPRPDGERIRVRILNGAGAPGVAQDVQPLLVDVGAQVTLSGNADRFDYETTQVVYYEDDRLDDARAIVEALGVGEVVKSLNELAVVDVTVVVGADFLAAHPGG